MPMPPTSITAVVGASAATGPLTKAIIGGPSGRELRGYGERAGAGRAAAACACWRRLTAGARQMWQMARARASAASAGFGGASSLSSRVTIAPTCALSARPLPVTAALTSLGVCRATGMPRREAQSMATALAWAVPITVRTLCWLNTRSTATNSGRCSSSHSSMPRSMATSRWPSSASAGVRTTPTPSIVSGRPATPSTTPTPHRVSPGSTPSTRMKRPLLPIGQLFPQAIGSH